MKDTSILFGFSIPEESWTYLFYFSHFYTYNKVKRIIHSIKYTYKKKESNERKKEKNEEK